MRIVYSWLKEFIDFDVDLSAIDAAKHLTDVGLEVEEHLVVGNDFSGVVVAEVKAKRKHPNADKLTLVDVITEKGGASTEVVCGASNVPEAGGRVLWAKPGATLPNGMTLGTKELKGVVSAGMLCAEDELGLGDSHDGIVVLNDVDDAPLGSDPRDSLRLRDDVFDLAMPANRADVLGHVGVARELAALTGARFKEPRVSNPIDNSAAWDGVGATIEDTRCSRYILRRVDGVSVKPSPLWMQHRLRLVGVRPISNIVDITNYVMFELGQPLHAFDSAKLTSDAIVVRSASNKDSIKTLDGEMRECQQGDLLICDGKTPVAVAGVMGGANTEVDAETTSVTLESAQFDPVSVRKTGRIMGLHSESSHRYERFVDPNGSDIASFRAATLLAELGGGTVLSGGVDLYAAPLTSTRVSMRLERCRSLTGVDIKKDDAIKIFESLKLSASDASDDVIEVDVPTFRSDITREVDLIEEIIRVYGFDKIAATLPRKTSLRRGSSTSDRMLLVKP